VQSRSLRSLILLTYSSCSELTCGGDFYPLQASPAEPQGLTFTINLRPLEKRLPRRALQKALRSLQSLLLLPLNVKVTNINQNGGSFAETGSGFGQKVRSLFLFCLQYQHNTDQSLVCSVLASTLILPSPAAVTRSRSTRSSYASGQTSLHVQSSSAVR
jgi:hypothetical protein